MASNPNPRLFFQTNGVVASTQTEGQGDDWQAGKPWHTALQAVIQEALSFAIHVEKTLAQLKLKNDDHIEEDNSQQLNVSSCQQQCKVPLQQPHIQVMESRNNIRAGGELSPGHDFQDLNGRMSPTSPADIPQYKMPPLQQTAGRPYKSS